MKKIEKLLYQTDFSTNTDLKDTLAKRLFSGGLSGKIIPGPFTRLTDEETSLVNAAMGIRPDDPLNEKYKK